MAGGQACHLHMLYIEPMSEHTWESGMGVREQEHVRAISCEEGAVSCTCVEFTQLCVGTKFRAAVLVRIQYIFWAGRIQHIAASREDPVQAAMDPNDTPVARREASGGTAHTFEKSACVCELLN